MLGTLRREPSMQPQAAIAAKDRAAVKLVLQKVHARSPELCAPPICTLCISLVARRSLKQSVSDCRLSADH